MARIRLALALAVNRPCAWDSRPQCPQLRNKGLDLLNDWQGVLPAPHSFLFIVLGRQGLWKRNISEEASSEKQTQESIIQDLALNKNWARRKINNRGNHTFLEEKHAVRVFGKQSSIREHHT